MLSFGSAHWPWENCQDNFFFYKIQDGRQITCYSQGQELQLLFWFVPRKQLTLDICWLHFGVILTSQFCVVYITKLVTVLYFSIINVFWLLNLCGAGGDACFAPQSNLVLYISDNHLQCNICFNATFVLPFAAYPIIYRQSRAETRFVFL